MSEIDDIMKAPLEYRNRLLRENIIEIERLRAELKSTEEVLHKPSPQGLSPDERLKWLLSDLMNAAENYFGASNPKRLGHIRCSAARIIDEIITPLRAELTKANTDIIKRIHDYGQLSDENLKLHAELTTFKKLYAEECHKLMIYSERAEAALAKAREALKPFSAIMLWISHEHLSGHTDDDDTLPISVGNIRRAEEAYAEIKDKQP